MSLRSMSDNTYDGRWEKMSHEDCARFFFNESHQITKERFFQVCCRTWMEDLVIKNGDDTKIVTYEFLWKTLKHLYLCSTKDGSTLIRWILPDLTIERLTDTQFNDYSNVGIEDISKARLMNFWRELYKCTENESSLDSLQERQMDTKSKRSIKRRRLGLNRFTSVDFKDILKGRYKLPAVYLIVSLMKETGIATDWRKLCDLAHDLPSIFKTFSGNDIYAGLALVGLVDVCTRKPLTGLSVSSLFANYFSGINSYGPSVLTILQDATTLDLYNLRASICRQVLNHLEKCDDNLSESSRLTTIDACADCMNQQHPDRVIDNLERSTSHLCGKRKQRKNATITNHPIPDLVASTEFPLLVHIQVWLLKDEVERATDLTRKIDVSACLNDEVKDDAWFNIWYYLLADGRLFLDGNSDTPGYLQKRDFLYNHMACQVSQNAKIAMFDFYQDVARRVCEHDDASLEEKQYVILACQQTVLRLLLKMRGLGSNTIREFVDKTSWPTEIPGRKSAKDLNEWASNFLLHNRKIPCTLIDQTTGLVDLSKRIDSMSYASHEKDDHVLMQNSPSYSINNPTEEERVFEVVRDEQSIPSQDDEFQQQKATRSNASPLAKNVHGETGQIVENAQEDDDVVILDDDDSDDASVDDLLVVETENVQENEEVYDIQDSDGLQDKASDSHTIHSNDGDENAQLQHSDDDENITCSDNENQCLDEESKKEIETEAEAENYYEKTGALHAENVEVMYIQERLVGSEDSDDNILHEKSRDGDSRTDGYLKKMNEDNSAHDQISRPENSGDEVDDEFEGSDDVRDETEEEKQDEGEHVDISITHTTEEEDGNDRFRANRTAQADRRADALRSRLGYASQVEDGYEPEDTHGYTEEEVSESIHTEDEDDERMPKQKNRLSDIETIEQQPENESHTNNEDKGQHIPSQIHDIVGNNEQQNSIEPTSDDMDMADERTEQEEEIAAEFSEPEENQEYFLDSKIQQSESTQAKTLLEFAQKAQNKDNWVGHLRDTESSSPKRNGTQEGGQIIGENALVPHETDLNNPSALSFDADDEKYATEGCKSLETEEEEDAEKDSSANITQEIAALRNDKKVGALNDCERKESKIENETKTRLVGRLQDETERKTFGKANDLREDYEVYKNKKHTEVDENHSASAIENSCAKSFEVDVKGTMLTENVSCGTKEIENNSLELPDDDNKQDCHKLDDLDKKVCSNEDASLVKKYEEASVTKERCGNDTDKLLSRKFTDEGREKDTDSMACSDKDSENEVEVEKKSDKVKTHSNVPLCSIGKSEQVTLSGEVDNLLSPTNRTMEIDTEYNSNRQLTFEVEKDAVIKDVASETHRELSTCTSPNAVTERKGDEESVCHSPSEANSEVLNANKIVREPEIHNDENSICANESNSGDGPSFNHPPPKIDNIQTPTQDDNLSKENTEIESTKADDRLESDAVEAMPQIETNICTSKCPSKQDDCSNTSNVLDVSSKDMATEGDSVVLDQIITDYGNGDVDCVEPKLNSEDPDLESNKIDCDNQSKETVGKIGAMITNEQKDDDVNIENKVIAVENTSEFIEDKKSVELESNQARAGEAVHRKSIDSGIPILNASETEEFKCNHPEESFANIPQFICGDPEHGLNETLPKQPVERSDQSIMGFPERKFEDGHNGEDELAETGDGGSVILENLRQHGSEKDDEPSAPTQTPQKQASISASKEMAGSLENTEVHEGALDESNNHDDGPLILDTSEQGEEESHTAGSNFSQSPSFKNIEDNETTGYARKKQKIRAGLPPRPPTEKSNDPNQHTARSKGKKGAALLQGTAPTRSTRSGTRKATTSPMSSAEKDKGTENDDSMSVQSTVSTRSTRSATRQSSRKSKASTRNDDESAKSAASTRSTRSGKRKAPSGSIASTQTDKGIESDDDVSVQSRVSTGSRATRKVSNKSKNTTHNDDESVQSTGKKLTGNVVGKAASRSKDSVQKDNGNETKDDVSVQSTASRRSTRSTTRKPSSDSIAPLKVELSVETKKSTRSTRSTARKLSSAAKVSKSKARVSENKSDDISVETETSKRPTRNSINKLSRGRGPEENEARIDDDVSIKSVKSSRSTRSGAIRSLSRGKEQMKNHAEAEIKDDVSVQSVVSTRSTRSANRNLPSTTKIQQINEETEIDDMNVRQLKEELKKKKIPFYAKARKKDLQDLLRSANEEE